MILSCAGQSGVVFEQSVAGRGGCGMPLFSESDRVDYWSRGCRRQGHHGDHFVTAAGDFTAGAAFSLDRTSRGSHGADGCERGGGGNVVAV